MSIHPDIDRPVSSTVNVLKARACFHIFQHYFCICQYGSRTFDVENAGKAKTGGEDNRARTGRENKSASRSTKVTRIKDALNTTLSTNLVQIELN